jgi:hypothetical protein
LHESPAAIRRGLGLPNHRRPRLDQGHYRHSPCPRCDEPPPLRTVLAPEVQLITRRRWCTDQLVDFHLVVETIDATGWRTVARFSMAHSNFHLVKYSWDPRRKVYVRFGLIDQVEHVSEAYRVATRYAYSRLQELLEDWRGTR